MCPHKRKDVSFQKKKPQIVLYMTVLVNFYNYSTFLYNILFIIFFP